MPYITQERRELVSVLIGSNSHPVATAGELQYVLAELIKRYWHTHEQNYQTINDILGALNGANLEFYRRVVAPYEDKKIEQNGDVY